MPYITENEYQKLMLDSVDGAEAKRLQAQKAALLAAWEAQLAYENLEPTPWGHDCQWCGKCADKLANMRDAAIAAAKEGVR